mmetsp:Transcript_23958/g.57811  ORF Transcript_23958/g.57811 Transcript_23958/m.57811 type:complete len:931 (+) Transcript_23958:89-2881(+)
MEPFTIKIAFQADRMLGFMLIDSEIDPDEYYESDGTIFSMRGGGTTPKVGNDDEASTFFGGGGGFSLELDFAAEAAAAAKGSQGKVHPTLRPPSAKRKRPTRICLSANSLVFKCARQLRATADKSSSPDVNSVSADCAQNFVDPFDIETLIELGREQLPQMQSRDGNVSLEAMNDEVLKFALTGTIQPGDIVEKIQYTRCSPPISAKVLSTDKRKRKRRCQSYLRSDYFTTLQCEHKLSMKVAAVLRSPQNYPLYITFMRPVPVFDSEGSNCPRDSPPRKRFKHEPNTGPTNNGARANNQQPKDEVICLLDSSDEEEDVKEAKRESPVDGSCSMAVTGSSMQVSKKTNSSTLLPQCVPPDPKQINFLDDDFVLTPFGPGKILSSRVERYASSSNHSDATIFKPTIIYSIDLHFGTCHVPARQVKPISGTSYTEETLITYQRVPLTGHDLLRLRPMTYLNDSIINFYLKYLRSQYDQKHNANTPAQKIEERGWNDLNGEGIHIFPSFCYTRIKNIMGPGRRDSKALRTQISKDLKSWTKGTDLFKKRFLIFPINEHLHWTCVIVCHPGRLVRRHAKDLHGKKENAMKVEDKTTGTGVSQSANNSEANPISDIKQKSFANSTSHDDNCSQKGSFQAGVNNATENQPPKKHITNESQVTNENSTLDCTEPKTGIAKQKPFSNSTNVPGGSVTKSSDDDKCSHAPENQPQKSFTTNESSGNTAIDCTEQGIITMRTECSTIDVPNVMVSKSSDDDNSIQNDSLRAQVNAGALVWQCDYCKTARFPIYDDAVKHEQTCEENVDQCIIHFDSGKHFKLHKMTEITGNIRKYLNAYYEAEYVSSHPGLASFTKNNMPAFSARVPQQNNTKDCGVFMLENAQRIIENPPLVNFNFVKARGANKKFLEDSSYDKYIIEKKRDDILQLIQTMRRGEHEIE